MRINLTKKDLVNSVYMQLGFSKQISENLIDDLLTTISNNIKLEKKLKLSKFGTFTIRKKKSRVGRNPKTKETKLITSREVILFKPAKEFKDLVNAVYMQLGFSKQISEILIDDFFSTIILNVKFSDKIKLSKFGTFFIRNKKQRIGRNPKTKEKKIISERKVVLFKPSKEFKDFINFKDNG